MIFDSLWTIIYNFLVQPLLSLPAPDFDISLGRNSPFIQMVAYANRLVDLPLLFGFIQVFVSVVMAFFIVRVILMLWKMIRG